MIKIGVPFTFQAEKNTFCRILVELSRKIKYHKNKINHILILFRGCLTDRISFCFDIATCVYI